MSTKTTPTATQLAREFANILNDWLTPEQIAEVNKRNASESNTHICHTHDFCDANQAMINALAEFDVELDVQSDEQTALIDAAWEIAKRDQFNVDPPHSSN